MNAYRGMPRTAPALFSFRSRGTARRGLTPLRHRRSVRSVESLHVRRSAEEIDRVAAARRSFRDLPRFDQALAALRADGIELGKARARAGFSRGHLLDLLLLDPAFGSAADESAQQIAERAADALLGEQLVDDWVGEIDVAPLGRGGPLKVVGDGEQSLPLEELQPAVLAAIDGLIAGLPDAPHHARAGAGEWTLFELEPERADDFAAQNDLVLATTSVPEMLKAFLQGLPLYSGRFSRHGELYCYLKLDGGGRTDEERLTARSALEDGLNSALVRAQAGSVVGNGLGLRYSYVDLAIADLSRAASILRQCVDGVWTRAWLLFCDTDRAGDWLALADGSEPPPGFD